MSTNETSVEQQLIEKLTQEESQWTYCPNLKTEADLWNNFKSILEANNRDKLEGRPLTDSEFQKVKNQVISNSFYEAGVKLAGESGIFHVEIARNNQPIILTVFNRAHKSGGTSVYQIINQYQSFSDDIQNRRFDLTFLINGLPLIHMELKNACHASYLDAFRQIQKYINEGHFKGIFSLVQMFVVSNGVQTKYIASNEVLNKEFLTSWTVEEDPDISIADLFDFSSHLLRIPQAHEMITDYCQLDAKRQSLMILRPYQIQAIQAMRKAYTKQKSGYIWHATGSGKTLTSYKASRNLLIDVPGIDKTIFLIDRKDLDDKTCLDFESYAETDTIDVAGTEDISELEKKLLSPKRQMIVTTIQKLQHLIRKYREDNPNEKKKEKLQALHLAFIVDECHRTVTRQTQVIINGFFPKQLWYGFTGTPIFEENQGALGATTERMYGKPLHCYTIKNAMHDKAILGFQVERLGAKNLKTDKDGFNIDEDLKQYDKKEHMLSVIDVIINQSKEKLGLTSNSFGQAYEAILTTGKIKRAQEYYNLFCSVKKDHEKVKLSSKIKNKYPDFPKIAITYSLVENKDRSEEESNGLKKAIEDYNKMFGTSFGLENIEAYNADVVNRFARKTEKYKARSQQLDIVIVAERLLTGFDAPCLSTIYIDRQPMTKHKLIQAFSRTNRLFDKNKNKGHIVTFQAPDSFKIIIDESIKLFSKGGIGDVLAPPFEEVNKELKEAILKLRAIASTPDICATFGEDKKRIQSFCYAFQRLDSVLFKIRTYMEWNNKNLENDYGLSLEDFDKYKGWYLNFIDTNPGPEPGPNPPREPGPDVNYELQTYGKENIDYLYIVRLMQEYVFSKNIPDEDIQDCINLLSKESPRLGEELTKLWNAVKANPNNFVGKDLIVIFEEMKEQTKKTALLTVCKQFCLNYDDVEYAACCYIRPQTDVPNFNQIKKNANPQEYSQKVGRQVRPLEYIKEIRKALIKTFNEYVLPFNNIQI